MLVLVLVLVVMMMPGPPIAVLLRMVMMMPGLSFPLQVMLGAATKRHSFGFFSQIDAPWHRERKNNGSRVIL
jgi:hypothetical protein